MSTPINADTDAVADRSSTTKAILTTNLQGIQIEDRDIEKSPVRVITAERLPGVVVVSWTNAADPEDPHNWNFAKKTFHIVGATATNLVMLVFVSNC